MKKHKKIIIIVVLLLLILFSFLIYYIPSLNWIDRAVSNVFVRIRCPLLTYLFYFFTTFGNFLSITLILLVAILLVRKLKNCLILTTSVGLVALLNYFIKIIIKRPRPEVFHFITEIGYSFPSGHSMSSSFFYGFLLLIILDSNLSCKIKKIAKIIIVPLIILIGISRIYFNVHYLSDVIAGLSMGSLALFIIWPLYQKIIIKE